MRQAVILAAGFGSRLARHDKDLKPMRKVGGGSLIKRNLLLLEAAGIEEVIIVVGYEGDALKAYISEETKHLDISVRFAFNDEYHKSNGLSVLTARPYIEDEFILLMADHIFEAKMFEEAAHLELEPESAVLFVDYKIKQVFDIPDATKVVTDGRHVLQISKELPEYNAIDTGLFVCSQALFDALEQARDRSAKRDCSLSEGVATLLQRGTMLVHDVGNSVWQDVDTELAVKHAEKLLRQNRYEQPFRQARAAAS